MNIFFRTPEVYKLDHRFPGKAAEGKPIAILYGQIGTDKLNDFHIRLKALAESGDIIYILRHFMKNRKGPKTRLSGQCDY